MLTELHKARKKQNKLRNPGKLWEGTFKFGNIEGKVFSFLDIVTKLKKLFVTLFRNSVVITIDLSYVK